MDLALVKAYLTKIWVFLIHWFKTAREDLLTLINTMKGVKNQITMEILVFSRIWIWPWKTALNGTFTITLIFRARICNFSCIFLTFTTLEMLIQQKELEIINFTRIWLLEINFGKIKILDRAVEWALLWIWVKLI